MTAAGHGFIINGWGAGTDTVIGPSMAKSFIYQIKTHYSKREDQDPAFHVLDNSACERLDWYEYWPIRNFLLSTSLDDEAFYGFVSPRFKEKTNLSGAAAVDFLNSAGATTDVVLLTPSLHFTAYYWNVFQYGNACHPGLLEIASTFFSLIGEPTDLHELVTHSQNEVYSNYVIAKPRFWRAWLAVTEQLFAIAERHDELGEKLRQSTSYRGRRDAQMKVFVMERIATWLLVRDESFKVRVHDPFFMRSRLYKLPGAILCDALKLAYCASGGQPRYKALFKLVSAGRKKFGLYIRAAHLLRLKRIRLLLSEISPHD